MSLPGARQFFELQKFPYLIFNADGNQQGSRYFNTRVIPQSSTKVEFLMGRNPSPALGIGWQSGCHSGWINDAFMLNYSAADNIVWIIYDNGTYGLRCQPTNSNFSGVFISFDANGMLVAGSTVLQSSQSLSLSSNEFYIGDVNENGTPKGETDNQGSAKMYWCKMYNNNVLMKHYVPAYHNDEAVLYELVSNTYLQSTGSFDVSSIEYGEDQISLIKGGRISMKQLVML